MTVIRLIGKLIPHSIVLAFFILEVSQLLTQPPTQDLTLVAITYLKSLLVFVVLPALYLVKLISYLFDLHPFDIQSIHYHGTGFIELALFSHFLYALIIAYMILRGLEAIF